MILFIIYFLILKLIIIVPLKNLLDLLLYVIFI
jgi:hypothetical protein